MIFCAEQNFKLFRHIKGNSVKVVIFFKVVSFFFQGQPLLLLVPGVKILARPPVVGSNFYSMVVLCFLKLFVKSRE